MINSIVVMFCFVIIISSYKNRISKSKKSILYIAFLLCDFFIIEFIYPRFKMGFNIFCVIILYCILIKLIYKDYFNILDIFYVCYLYFGYTFLKHIINNMLVLYFCLLFVAIECNIAQEKLRTFNYNMIMVWNDKSEKSLTVRCILIVTFNAAFYTIFRITNL